MNKSTLNQVKPGSLPGQGLKKPLIPVPPAMDKESPQQNTVNMVFFPAEMWENFRQKLLDLNITPRQFEAAFKELGPIRSVPVAVQNPPQ